MQRARHGLERVLKELIRRFGFEIARVYTAPDGSIVIDFYDPALGDDVYLRSSVACNPGTGYLEATVRTALRRYKELYLDYCIEDCALKCRPHFYVEDGVPIVSIEAKFRTEPLERFKSLLNELNPLS